jgi:hypothetical protein
MKAGWISHSAPRCKSANNFTTAGSACSNRRTHLGFVARELDHGMETSFSVSSSPFDVPRRGSRKTYTLSLSCEINFDLAQVTVRHMRSGARSRNSLLPLPRHQRCTRRLTSQSDRTQVSCLPMSRGSQHAPPFTAWCQCTAVPGGAFPP